MKKYGWLVSGVLLAACSGDNEAEDVDVDQDVQVTDLAETSEIEEEVLEDTSPDAQDTTPEIEVSEEVSECPESIVCLDPFSGNPSIRVCTDAGYPEGTLCLRSGDVACCVPPFFCETDEQCEGARATEDFCPDSRFPCRCEQESGSCYTALCASSSECAEGEVCSDGLCAAAPSATEYIARVLTPAGFISDGASVALDCVAVRSSDPTSVSPDIAVSWSATGAGGTITAAGVLTGASAGGPVTATCVVTDNAADTGDSVTFTNVGAPPADGVRLLVVDEATRAPVAGAIVLAGDSQLETAADGTVVLPIDGPATFHVFDANHAYVSILGATGRNLLVALPPNQVASINEIRDGFVCEGDSATAETEACGAAGEPVCLCYDLEGVDVVKGAPDFTDVPPTGDTVVSINGFGLGNSLLDLNFDLILGPNVERVLPEGTPLPLDGPQELPSGVTLGFNGSPVIETFIATAPAGTRTVWSIGGVVRLSEILPLILPALGGNLNIGSIIAALLPFFDDFYTGVSAPIELSADGTFPVRAPDLRMSLPTLRRVSLDVPALPVVLPADGDAATVYAETVIVLGGALLPGEGFIPLGITGGSDAFNAADADGRVDGDLSTPEIDPLEIAMSPRHGTLSGPSTRYMFASVALMLNEDTPGIPREASSGVITLLDGDELPASVDTGAASFPSFALGSQWDVASRTLQVEAESSPDMYRVVLRDRSNHLWVAYAPGDLTELTLPAVPGEGQLDDRAAGDRVTVNIVGIGLRDSDGVNYQSLLAADGKDLTDLFMFVREFSILGL